MKHAVSQGTGVPRHGLLAWALCGKLW